MAKTFEEWRKTRKYHMAVNDAETAWGAAMSECQGELLEKDARIAELEGIDKVADHANESIVKMQATIDALERKLERVTQACNDVLAIDNFTHLDSVKYDGQSIRERVRAALQEDGQ